MSDFTPINTQEELDQIIGERIKRERESLSKKYGDYDAIKKTNDERGVQIETLTKELKELNEKHSGSEKTIAELNARVKGYETDSVKTRIALELGLPYGMHDRITGEKEEDIRKDAEALKAMIVSGQQKSPKKDPEMNGSSGDDYKKLLSQLNIRKD